MPKGQSIYEIEYKEFKGDETQYFSFSNPEKCQTIISRNQTNEILLGTVVYTTNKPKNFYKKVGRTIAWPFKQIGKIF